MAKIEILDRFDTYRNCPLLSVFNTLGELPPVGQGDPAIALSAPVFWSIVNPDTSLDEAFTANRNLLYGCTITCPVVLPPEGKGDPAMGFSEPESPLMVNPEIVFCPWFATYRNLLD